MASHQSIIMIFMILMVCISFIFLATLDLGGIQITSNSTSAYLKSSTEINENIQEDNENNPHGNSQVNAIQSNISHSFSPPQSLKSQHLRVETSYTANVEINAINSNATRGFILSLHDDIVPMGLSLIRELRCLGNNEVVEVYHCMNEISAKSQEIMLKVDSNIRIIDICAHFIAQPQNGLHMLNGMTPSDAKSFKNYWLKPLAVTATNLTELILLDGDDILMSDPARIRSLPQYQETGTLFFYDRVVAGNRFFNRDHGGKKMLKHLLETFEYGRFGISPSGSHPSKHMLQTFAYKGKTGHEMDSSMVLIDKSKAGKAIDVLQYLIVVTRKHLNFSWGDKESFWLAYELARQAYSFSPWGLSLVDSEPNKDLKDHPNTLCGSMAHWIPDTNETAELLYVNGKALLEPFPVGIDKMLKQKKRSRMFNLNPTKITPRYNITNFDTEKQKSFECLDNIGSTELPPNFSAHLLRRRYHYYALQMGVYDAVNICVGGDQANR